MTGELIVDPGALKTFAGVELQAHLDAINGVLTKLEAIVSQPSSSAMFGEFDTAHSLNSRTSDLLNEVYTQMRNGHSSLAALQSVAQECSTNYQASDELSAASIAAVNKTLGSFEAHAPTTGAL